MSNFSLTSKTFNMKPIIDTYSLFKLLFANGTESDYKIWADGIRTNMYHENDVYLQDELYVSISYAKELAAVANTNRSQAALYLILVIENKDIVKEIADCIILQRDVTGTAIKNGLLEINYNGLDIDNTTKLIELMVKRVTDYDGEESRIRLMKEVREGLEYYIDHEEDFLTDNEQVLLYRLLTKACKEHSNTTAKHYSASMKSIHTLEKKVSELEAKLKEAQSSCIDLSQLSFDEVCSLMKKFLDK